MARELRDSVLIQKYLFHEPERIEGVVRGADAFPDVAQMIIAYATGTLSYPAARRRLLSKLPARRRPPRPHRAGRVAAAHRESGSAEGESASSVNAVSSELACGPPSCSVRTPSATPL